MSGRRRAGWWMPVREVRAGTVVFVGELRVESPELAAVHAEITALRAAVAELAAAVSPPTLARSRPPASP